MMNWELIREEDLACVVATAEGVALGATVNVKVEKRSGAVVFSFPEPMDVEYTARAAVIHLLLRDEPLLTVAIDCPQNIVKHNTMSLRNFEIKVT